MRQFRIPFSAMASGCEVVLGCDDEGEALTLAESAINEVQRIETKFSRYRPDSIIARINAAAGGAPVECDAETLSLLEFADSSPASCPAASACMKCVLSLVGTRWSATAATCA